MFRRGFAGQVVVLVDALDEAIGYEGRARVLSRAQKWLIVNSDRVLRTSVSESGETWADAMSAEIGYAAAAFGCWAKHAP